MRPSTSGRTTFIARSDGDSPRSAASQSRRRLVDRATWNTGQDQPSNGPAFPPENPVAFTTSTGPPGRASASQSPRPGALSDGAKTPIAAMPRARNARISASMGATSAAASQLR